LGWSASNRGPPSALQPDLPEHLEGSQLFSEDVAEVASHGLASFAARFDARLAGHRLPHRQPHAWRTVSQLEHRGLRLPQELQRGRAEADSLARSEGLAARAEQASGHRVEAGARL